MRSIRVLTCLGLLAAAAGLLARPAGARAAGKTFTYHLRMNHVDWNQGAKAYGGPRASLIGFGTGYTAGKRLPYKIGPGRVRAYVHLLPEQGDRRITVTIGGQSKSTVLTPQTPRYHREELVFDLKEPTDRVRFRAESVDGQKQRSIWYATTLTNDPAQKHLQVAPNKYKLFYVPPMEANPPGNLLPNSGFEEGIAHWDLTASKGGVIVKPRLLRKQAAHGTYSLQVPPFPMYTRWFPLKNGLGYTLSFYVPAERTGEVRVELYRQNRGGQDERLLRAESTEAKPSDVPGWQRVVAKVTLPEVENFPASSYRLALLGAAGQPPRVDSFQLVEGPDRPYRPHAGLEANFVSPRTQALCQIGGDNEIAFNLFRAEDTQVGRVTYTVYDYYDRVVQGERALTVRTNPSRQPVAVPTDRAGFFRVRTRIDYEQGGTARTVWRDFFYNVVHPSQPRKERREWSQFGGYFTAAPRGPFSFEEGTRAFGIYEFNSLGHYLARWKPNMVHEDRKPVPGKYDFSRMLKEVEGFRAADIQPTANFHVNAGGGSYGIPECYRNPKTGPVFTFRARSRGGDKPVTFSQKAWLEFARKFARAFDGKISKIVVQDEPLSYFTPEEYARFHLETYKAVKEVAPDLPVFVDCHNSSPAVIDALNKHTGGKAHEYVDGVHAYLTESHSSKGEARQRFLGWLREHDKPLVTVTCFSGARRMDAHEIAGPPCYAEQRAAEINSIHHPLDGFVWGGSKCFYYYYATFPRRGYANIFDQHGRLFPMIHFYAAANAVLGPIAGHETVDVNGPFRAGILTPGRTDGPAGVFVFYGQDGRPYDFAVDAAGIAKVLDGFGNPMDVRRKGGKLHGPCGPRPVYLVLKDVDAARPGRKRSRFTERFDVRFSYAPHPDGLLTLRTFLSSDEPLEARARVQDAFRPNQRRLVTSQRVARGLYELDIPLAEGAWRSSTRDIPLRIATNRGDILGSYRPYYAAITRAEGVTVNGEAGEGEWPRPRANGMVLRERYEQDGQQHARTRGSAILALAGGTLCGKLELTRWNDACTFTLTLMPVDAKTGLPQPDKKCELTFQPKAGTAPKPNAGPPSGTALLDGQAVAGLQMAAERFGQRKENWRVEFAVPAGKLPGFEVRHGRCYGCDVRVTAPQKLKNRNDWPNAGWAPAAPQAPGDWPQVMIVTE